ncbi:MAG: acyltransferase [Hyphomicrobium sp.]|nr:acyltransferase [Hyphomicrobium sp.]
MNARGRASKAPHLDSMLEPRANNFTLVRIVMALAVLISHGFFLHTGTPSAEPLVTWTGYSLGEHAVQVFFFLSGILVAQSFDRSAGMLDFTAGRVLRIFPGLIVCVFIAAFVIGPAATSLPLAMYLTSPDVLRYVLRTVSLATGSATLPGVFESVPAAGLVNMSLWTLKYEVMCYAGLALAACAGLFKTALRPYAIAGLAVLVAVLFIEPAKSVELYTPADNMRYFAVFFASGVLAYLMRSALVIHGGILAVLLALFVATAGTPFGVPGAAAFLGYATLYVARWPLGALRDLSNRYDISFGIYIYACPIQQLLIGHFPEASAVELILLAIALTVPAALVSWLLVERPALRARTRVASGLTWRVPSMGLSAANLASAPPAGR